MTTKKEPAKTNLPPKVPTPFTKPGPQRPNFNNTPRSAPHLSNNRGRR